MLRNESQDPLKNLEASSRHISHNNNVIKPNLKLNLFKKLGVNNRDLANLGCNSQKLEADYRIIEEETDRKVPGMCFGYDGLMLKKARTSSTCCLEDTWLLVLGDVEFERSIGRAIFRCDLERKQFLINRIPSFRNNEKIFVSLFKFLKTQVSKHKYYSFANIQQFS